MSEDHTKWYRGAKCIGMPISFFFGSSEKRPGAPRAVIKEAKRFCTGASDGRPCPVLAACGDAAFCEEKGSHRYGVRGGMSPWEREHKDAPARLARRVANYTRYNAKRAAKRADELRRTPGRPTQGDAN